MSWQGTQLILCSACLGTVLSWFFCCFLFRFAIIFKKGYQEFDSVQGAITTKVKGVAKTENLFSNTSGPRIWDVNDYVVPPQVGEVYSKFNGDVYHYAYFMYEIPIK